MADSSMSKVGLTHLNEDRISMLPRNIQETILCFLPILDAVRTSILSTSWRHCWTMIPNLVFDEYILPALSTKYNMCHGPELAAFKFFSVINKVLLLHNGSILKFSLSFPDFCDGNRIHDFADQWIPLFSRKGIKQLTVEGNYNGDLTACNFSSLNLTHLRLANVWLPFTPAFRRLTYLRIIELIEVGASEQNIFDCPVLEKLTLICTGLLPINFRAPNLKILHQMYRVMTSVYSLAGLENLKEFSCGLSYDPEMPTETSNVVEVFGSLHKIEKISIRKCFIMYLAAEGSPNRFPNPLPYLKTLSISNVNLYCSSEVSCLLCLLRSAPNLCKLHISANPYAEEENFKDYWKEDFENYAVGHLEIVTLSYLKGLQAELELVKFLLAHSPLLKTVFIHCNPNMENDVASKMLEEMVEFSRASSRAQIKYLKCPFDAVNYGPWVNRLNTCSEEHIFL